MTTTTGATPRARRWPSILRGVVLFALAGMVLHLLGAKVGGWTNGSLGPVATLLVGVVAPAWLLVCFPTWFAWRVAKPLGWRSLAHVACWFSPLVNRRELASLRVFLDVDGNQAFPEAGAIPADAWTALAAALQAERQGNLARANRIVDALRCLPQESAFPWLARCHGVEALVLQAWERKDWPTVQAYADIGRGRVVRWLTYLAAAELGPRSVPRTLWLEWARSPIRCRTYAFARDRWARSRVAPQVVPAPIERKDTQLEIGLVVDVRLRHVSRLWGASRGERVPTGEILALTKAWQPHFDKAAMARFVARGLELDVRDAHQQAQALRDSVLDDLIVLASLGEDELATRPTDGDLVADLVSGLRDQLCQQVEASLAGIDPTACVPSPHPLEAWERWLALREAWDRLCKQSPTAAAALWNARVATAVWNGTCAIFNQHGKRSAWVAHMMYWWIAEQAESLGDMRTVVVNRENARIALCA